MEQQKSPSLSGMRARWHEMEADQVGEVLVASMKLAGIDRLWFVSGTELTFFQEVAVKNRVLGRPTPRIMTMTHENAALAAACGETMVTGRPAAAAFHVEVGLLNAGGAIHNADRGKYPVLIISGYPPTAEAGTIPGARNAFIQWYQQIRDQGQIVRQYTKWDHKLASYDNAGLVITRAVQVMMSHPQGPAYLALPREVAMSPTGGTARFPLLDQLRPAVSPAADRDELRVAARWLLESRSPLIVTSKYGRNPEAVGALVELAETLGARIMADTFRMSVPGRHPLHRGIPALAPVPPDTDCVLVIDAVVPWMPGQFEPSPEARIIRIDLDPVETMTPIYDFPSDLSITADSAKAVPALLEEVRSLMTPEQKRRCGERLSVLLDEGRRRLDALLAAAQDDAKKGYITPRYLSYQIGETLGPEVTILHELVDSSLFNRSIPGTLLGTGGSSIGWSAPAAIGVKVAAPDRTVVAAVGDGSWMFGNPQVTVWASQFHKAPVLFLVHNNRGYRTGTEAVLQMHPEGYAAREKDLTGGWFDPCPNYAGEAAASGAYGEKVTEPDQVAPALRRGLEAVQKDGVPAVLDFWLPKLVTGEV